MSSENPHITALNAYRDMLVESRRSLVQVDVTSKRVSPDTVYEREREPNTDRVKELVALQEQIEAVDRAIQDEKNLEPSLGPRVRSL